MSRGSRLRHPAATRSPRTSSVETPGGDWPGPASCAPLEVPVSGSIPTACAKRTPLGRRGVAARGKADDQGWCSTPGLAVSSEKPGRRSFGPCRTIEPRVPAEAGESSGSGRTPDRRRGRPPSARVPQENVAHAEGRARPASRSFTIATQTSGVVVGPAVAGGGPVQHVDCRRGRSRGARASWPATGELACQGRPRGRRAAGVLAGL